MDAEIVDDGICSTATGLGCCAQEGDKSAALTCYPRFSGTLGVMIKIEMLPK